MGIGAGLGKHEEISLPPGFNPRTVLPVAILFIKTEVL